MAKGLPTITPNTDVFVPSEGSGGVSQVLNPFIFIILIKFRGVGLRMLSIGLHLALLCPNMSAIRLYTTVSEELQAAHNR